MEKRKKVDVKNEEGKKEKLFLYYDGESVSGKVCVCVCVCVCVDTRGIQLKKVLLSARVCLKYLDVLFSLIEKAWNKGTCTSDDIIDHSVTKMTSPYTLGACARAGYSTEMKFLLPLLLSLPPPPHAQYRST